MSSQIKRNENFIEVIAEGQAPAWHKLGTIKKMGELLTAQEVKELAGQDYMVLKSQNHVKNPNWKGIDAFLKDKDISPDNIANILAEFEAQRFKAGAGFSTIRYDQGNPTEDHGAALGTVGDRYEVFQNEEMYDFLEQFRDASNGFVNYATAGTLNEGQTVFVSAKIPSELRVGTDDKIDQYLLITNAHDGSGTLRILWTPIRVVCYNTLMLALSMIVAPQRQRRKLKTTGHNGNYVSIKHTVNMRDQVDKAIKFLGLIKSTQSLVGEKFASYKAAKMTDRDFTKLLVNTYLTDQQQLADLNKLSSITNNDLEAAGVSTRTRNHFDHMREVLATAPGQRGNVGDFWGGYNAITYNLSHEGKSDEANFANTVTGTAATTRFYKAERWIDQQLTKV